MQVTTKQLHEMINESLKRNLVKEQAEDQESFGAQDVADFVVGVVRRKVDKSLQQWAKMHKSDGLAQALFVGGEDEQAYNSAAKFVIEQVREEVGKLYNFMTKHVHESVVTEQIKRPDHDKPHHHQSNEESPEDIESVRRWEDEDFGRHDRPEEKSWISDDDDEIIEPDFDSDEFYIPDPEEEFPLPEDEDDYDDSMDGDHESALASAGFGTDEDYGSHDGGFYEDW